VAPLREQVAAMEAEVAQLRTFRRQAVVAEWTEHRTPLIDRLSDISWPDLRRHVAAAITQAELSHEPTPHLVVNDVLPHDVYELMAAAIPPAEAFPDRDPVKTDLEMSALGEAPQPTARAWQLFDERIVQEIVAPLTFARLADAVAAHYAGFGGTAFGLRAAAIPHRSFAGRIQLRRPGYALAPHLDPKRVAITGLFYFPRPGDPEEFGTALYSVEGPTVGPSMATFFPEGAGATCRLVRSVPYRANSLLAFVNSRAAHGASLPIDAPLAERYTYQFYVKPDDGQLKQLLRTLPSDAQKAWQELLG
jgi:hypothetical protein